MIWTLLFCGFCLAENYPKYTSVRYKNFYAELGKIEYYPGEKSLEELEIRIKELRQKLEKDPDDLASLKKAGVYCHAEAVKEKGTLQQANLAENYFDRAIAILQSSNKNPKLLNNLKGWKGGVLALKPKFGLNLIEIMRVSKQGTDLLDRAIYNEPEDMELRFLRANTYIYFPKFMGKNAVVLVDLKYLLSYFQTYYNEKSDVILNIYALFSYVFKNEGEKEKTKYYALRIRELAPDSVFARQTKSLCGN